MKTLICLCGLLLGTLMMAADVEPAKPVPEPVKLTPEQEAWGKLLAEQRIELSFGQVLALYNSATATAKSLRDYVVILKFQGAATALISAAEGDAQNMELVRDFLQEQLLALQAKAQAVQAQAALPAPAVPVP